MKALVLEKSQKLQLKDIASFDNETLGCSDVRIEINTCGICGSDIHYYKEGRIGDFVVEQPMVLGHEASGTVIETGRHVTHLKVGDRVCMEPGIPNFSSPEVLSGMYNLDENVRFWATPPVHGCLRETVVHPASFTFPLPENVPFVEGALVEPMAVGFYSVQKSQVPIGSTALVLGAGTIGIVTAIAARAAGFTKVFIADLKTEKLDFVAQHYDGIIPINIAEQPIKEFFAQNNITGVHVLFEASGSDKVYHRISDLLLRRGKLILIGMPSQLIQLDVVSLQVKEISIDSIFRYVNVFPQVLDMIAAGNINVAPLVTKIFPFQQSVEAFHYAASSPDNEIKIAIKM